jgi:hypothetical protein
MAKDTKDLEVSTYDDLYLALGTMSANQREQPIQAVYPPPVDDSLVVPLLPVIYFGTLQELGLDKTKSSADAKHHADHHVLGFDYNMLNDDGTIGVVNMLDEQPPTVSQVHRCLREAAESCGFVNDHADSLLLLAAESLFDDPANAVEDADEGTEPPPAKLSPSIPIPPDPDDMNDRRSDLAEIAVNAFAEAAYRLPGDRNDRHMVLGDLLCDIRHFCDRQNIKFSAVLQDGNGRYHEETQDGKPPFELSRTIDPDVKAIKLYDENESISLGDFRRITECMPDATQIGPRFPDYVPDHYPSVRIVGFGIETIPERELPLLAVLVDQIPLNDDDGEDEDLDDEDEDEDDDDGGPCKVIMSSEEFGAEEFKYDTFVEAQQGLLRLTEECAARNDGIERTFRIAQLDDEEDEDDDDESEEDSSGEAS